MISLAMVSEIIMIATVVIVLMTMLRMITDNDDHEEDDKMTLTENPAALRVSITVLEIGTLCASRCPKAKKGCKPPSSVLVND